MTDGDNYKVLPVAKDYKRIGEGDKGLNTGGMGSVTPVPFADAVYMEKVRTRIIEPVSYTHLGSGTIPVEAALIAKNIAPGVFRKGFAFEKWVDFDADMFDQMKVSDG